MFFNKNNQQCKLTFVFLNDVCKNKLFTGFRAFFFWSHLLGRTVALLPHHSFRLLPIRSWARVCLSHRIRNQQSIGRKYMLSRQVATNQVDTALLLSHSMDNPWPTYWRNYSLSRGVGVSEASLQWHHHDHPSTAPKNIQTPMTSTWTYLEHKLDQLSNLRSPWDQGMQDIYTFLMIDGNETDDSIDDDTVEFHFSLRLRDEVVL